MTAFDLAITGGLFSVLYYCYGILNHFQFAIRYKTGTKLLTSLRKSTSSHTSNTIYEWRRLGRLIKVVIRDQLLVDWFTKSLFPPIAKYVTMGGTVTEEKVINHAKYLELVYSHSGTLYNLILNAPRPSNDPLRPTTKAHVDGVVGSIKTLSTTKSAGQLGQLASIITSSQTITNSKQTPSPALPSKVNVVQSALTIRRG